MTASSSSEQHVRYVVSAEFDIDRGPVIKYQYPESIGHDAGRFAALMIPDGAHARDQDWTVFFYPQADNHGNCTSVLHVLNLVNTSLNNSHRRGGSVKSMAIFTKHPFIQVFKPVLLLALQKYVENSTIDVLKQLYDSLQAIDLSDMPRFTLYEQRLLSINSSKVLFSEKFYKSRPRTSLLRRASSIQHAGSFSSTDSLASTVMSNHDTHLYECKLSFNGLDIPMRVPVDSFSQAVGAPSPLPLISTFVINANVTPYSSLHPHLTTSGPTTHPLIVMINAFLTEKRVIFLGNQRPASEVVDIVLSAIALVSSGTLCGFTARAFPYTELGRVEELLKVKGYIAGVTNAAFKHHTSWWDVLCDIETGQVIISSNITNPMSNNFPKTFPRSSHESTGVPEDAVLVNDLRQMFKNLIDENTIRNRFRKHILRFIRMSSAHDELRQELDPVLQKNSAWYGLETGMVIRGHGCVWTDAYQKTAELIQYGSVLENWKKTVSYSLFVKMTAEEWPLLAVKNIDIDYHIERLRKIKIGKTAAGKIYLAFSQVIVTSEQITQLLLALTQGPDTLDPIAIGLFHPDANVREAVVQILDSIRCHIAGQHYFDQLNRFYKHAFNRARKTTQSETNSNMFANFSGITLA
ncbi:stabilization of polarity axis-domain-containing protein [Lipomyces japonicus]|uniref:stabilization of polarity axis-domain-containing protein n=1 Tax=Lipomyces japonicus TaxID=56871 RepID=UPI0034CDB57A